MRFAIGIDPSLTGTGVVVLDESGQTIKSDIVSSVPSGLYVQNRMNRNERLVTAVMATISAHRPEVICIEAYSYGSGGDSDRVEYGGLLRYAIWRSGHKFYEVAPTTLKKFASGKGNGDKTATIAGLTARYGVMFRTNDEYDAYALARIAMQIAKFEEPATTAQREAVATVTAIKIAKPKKKKARA